VFVYNVCDLMNPKYTFLSILTSDDYLPGLLVLAHSLQKTGTPLPLLVLLTPNISSETLTTLDSHRIAYKVLDYELINPTNVDKKHRWFSTYSKIFAFGQTEYDKVVYLDADMLILRNIDELFNYPHMSATNSGGMLPRKVSWTHLNSGLMIIEPSKKIFTDMLNRIGKIEVLEAGGSVERPQYGSDQDFFNKYYPNWPNQKELHLDHKYNIFHYHLDEYSKLFGYTIEDGPKPISIIHYASYLKPWNIKSDKLDEIAGDLDRCLELKAIQLWIEQFNSIRDII